MVINRKYIKEDRDSWKVLFDPRYKGRIAMLSNVYDVLAVGCKLLGYSLNTQDPQELAKVRELLLEQKKLLKGYLDYGTMRNCWSARSCGQATCTAGRGCR